MTIKRIGTGPRLSRAVIHGNTVYLAGVTASDRDGHDITSQTKQVLDKIDATLAEAGTDKSKLLRAQIWLKDFSDAAGMNAVWCDWIPENEAPARATVESPLATPEILVEIQVVAALD